MSKPKGKFMDLLDAISSESSGSESETDAHEEEEGAKVAKKAKKEITLDDLQKAGYKSGPSVLLMKPKDDDIQYNYNWGDGRQAKLEEEEETEASRAETRRLAQEGADVVARQALAAQQEAERLREARRKEKEEMIAANKLSFNSKEKRKRDEGKQSRGKSFVEEEKRMQRDFGMYSGFDT